MSEQAKELEDKELEDARTQVLTWQSIELDCPPGYPRPWTLIHDVIKDTGLVLQGPETDADHSAVIFGEAAYYFDVPRAEWVERIQPIIIPRITALHEAGRIRYGSW